MYPGFVYMVDDCISRNIYSNACSPSAEKQVQTKQRNEAGQSSKVGSLATLILGRWE